MRREPYINKLWSAREDLNAGFHAKGLPELTQERLAKMVGTSRQTIISIEQERSQPSYPLAIRIFGALQKHGSKIGLLELFPVPGASVRKSDGN